MPPINLKECLIGAPSVSGADATCIFPYKYYRKPSNYTMQSQQFHEKSRVPRPASTRPKSDMHAIFFPPVFFFFIFLFGKAKCFFRHDTHISTRSTLMPQGSVASSRAFCSKSGGHGMGVSEMITNVLFFCVTIPKIPKIPNFRYCINFFTYFKLLLCMPRASNCLRS